MDYNSLEEGGAELDLLIFAGSPLNSIEYTGLITCIIKIVTHKYNYSLEAIEIPQIIGWTYSQIKYISFYFTLFMN